MKSFPLVSVILAFAAALPSLAQTASTPPADERGHKRGPVLRVTALGDWLGPELDIMQPEPGTPPDEIVRVPIDPKDMCYSPAVPFRKDRPLWIVKRGSPPEKPEILLKVAIPSNVRQPLLLLVPKNGKVVTRIFDTNPSVFPYGSIHVVNFTTDELGVLCGKKGGRVSKGGTYQLSPARPGGKPAPELLSIGNPKDGKHYFKSMIMRRPEKRMLVFFLTDPKDPSGPPINRMLVDFRQAPVDNG